MTRVISTEVARLRDKWVEFRRTCSAEDQLDLKRFDPSVESVLGMVEEIASAWQDKRRKNVGGKTITFFHKFCDSLNAHSSLLKVLPEGSEYVSIFTGTLNAVIKVGPKNDFIRVSAIPNC